MVRRKRNSKAASDQNLKAEAFVIDWDASVIYYG